MRRILTFALLTAVALSGCKKGGGDGPESDEPVTKSVTVGTQSGTVTVGTSGSATFPVTTSGIANGTAARLEFYLDSNGKEGEEVTGFMADYLVKITATVTNISSGGSATATISYDATDGYAAAGNYPFRIIADDVRSDVKTFVLSPADAPAKTITVGTQHGTMTAGTAGTVTYAVETTGYAAGDYVIQGLRNFPTDVSLTNDDVITIGADGKGTLTLEGGTNTTQGTTSDLQISWGDSVWSNNFSLTISPAAVKTVEIGVQDNEIYPGTSGTLNFPVTTTHIADGTYLTTLSTPTAGISVRSGILKISEGKGTLVLNTSTSVKAGVYNLTLKIDGTMSNTFTLTVGPLDPGDGSAGNPFKVYDVATLKKVSSWEDNWSYLSNYKQMADIDLKGVDWTPIDILFGTYDGGGYTISSLTINHPGEDFLGLFGNIAADSGSNKGVVKNVALVNVNITGDEVIGGITASIGGGTIENCYVTGSIKGGGGSVGGIAGSNADGIIQNCYATCSVSGGNSRVGGITGSTYSDNDYTARITSCYATGAVSGTDLVAGIAGANGTGSRISNCVALNPSVKSSHQWSNVSMGRVTGTEDSGVFDCYARSNMVCQYSGNDLPITYPISNRKDGGNITAVDYNGANAGTWWSDSSRGNFNTTNWSLAANRLPHLKTTTGAAFSQSQNPAVQ